MKKVLLLSGFLFVTNFVLGQACVVPAGSQDCQTLTITAGTTQIVLNAGNGTTCNGKPEATVYITEIDAAGNEVCQPLINLTSGGYTDVIIDVASTTTSIEVCFWTGNANPNICDLFIPCLQAICPMDGDLGTFDCDELAQIPAAPTVMNVVGSTATIDDGSNNYGISITNFCGSLIVTTTDDIVAPYDICADAPIIVTRTVTIVDDIDGDGKRDLVDEDANGNGMLGNNEDDDMDGNLDVREDLSFCTFTFTINPDTEGPSIDCPDNVVDLTCGAALPTAATSLSGTDNCSDATSFTVTMVEDAPTSITSFCTADNRTIVRTYTVQDDCMNTGTCMQNITYAADVTPPVPSCPMDMVIDVNPACGNPTTVNLTAVTATDNCDATPSIIQSIGGVIDASTSVMINVGSTVTISYAITDDCMNSANCSYDITVQDGTSPTIMCPMDIIVCADADACTWDAENIMATIAENCPNTLTYTIDFASGTDITVPVDNAVTDVNTQVFPLGTSTVSFTITEDLAPMNSANCSFDITINDCQPPTFICPTDVTFNLDDNCTYDLAALIPTPTVMDNCPLPSPSITFVDTENLTGCSNTGSIMRIWTATDGSGNANTAICVQTITLTDPTPPVISCPSDVNITVDASCSFDLNSITVPTVTDNCPIPNSISFTDDMSGLSGCANTGTIVRTWTISDACGNAATPCLQNIIIEDSDPTCCGPAYVLDFDIDFGDPCSCTDPLNCNGLLHDVLTVTTTPVTPGLDIRIASSTDYFIDVPCPGVGPAGTPAAPVAPTPLVTQITETATPGTYTLEFWRPQGVIPAVSVSVDGGTAVPVPSSELSPACVCQIIPPDPIPTMSEWGLLIFGLLILNLGVLFLYRKEEVIAA